MTWAVSSRLCNKPSRAVRRSSSSQLKGPDILSSRARPPIRENNRANCISSTPHSSEAPGPDSEWPVGDLPNYVTHLECSLSGERYGPGRLHGLSHAGKPLLVRYDLDAIRRALPRDALAARPQTLWRYREMLPVCRPEN